MTEAVGYGPAWPIEGPPPLAPKYGLLQAMAAPAAGVRLVEDVDARGYERWINGVMVRSYPQGVAHVWDACRAGSHGATKGTGSPTLLPEFGAMTVYFSETCTVFQVPDQEAFKARAVAALSVVEGAAVEKEFLGGAQMLLNPHLADGNGTFPHGNVATSPRNGLALLEAEIAKSGKQGLIHCSPQVATVLRESWTLDDRTGVLRTVNGIVVIPGFGYVYGASPASHPAATGTQEWMYASGPVDVRRSEIFMTPDNVSEAVDRGTGGADGAGANSITYRAERYYLVDWDTEVQAAVLIDRCQTTC